MHNSKKNKIFWFLGLFVAALILFTIWPRLRQKSSEDASPVTQENLKIEYPEPYELSNIILALTEYGQTDEWEVRKGFPYYEKVMAHFEPFLEHPLLDSVNFSREKWKEFLSFRTDSYAFEFNEEDRLERIRPFLTNPGVRPFDDHLELVNDFITETDFRRFFKEQKAFRDSILANYSKDYFIEEMRSFLTKEFSFPIHKKEYRVVLSPFVYRMNCHRTIDSITEADFPTIADYVVFDSIPGTLENKIIECHTLFTEMDHTFVNPASTKHKKIIAEFFNDSLWDKDSGYQEYPEGVFNEYMTWGVYDLFVQEFFPEQVNPLTTYWHYQNDSRGFPYSFYFTNLLKDVYGNREKNERIEDLYPELLKELSKNQQYLKKPKFLEEDTIALSFNGIQKIQLRFSEPMEKMGDSEFLIRHHKKIDTINFKDLIGLAWSDDGRILDFGIDLSPYKDAEYVFMLFNWWGVQKPLLSKQGILLTSGSRLTFKNG